MYLLLSLGGVEEPMIFLGTVALAGPFYGACAKLVSAITDEPGMRVAIMAGIVALGNLPMIAQALGLTFW